MKQTKNDMRLEDIRFKAKRLTDNTWIEGDLSKTKNGKVWITNQQEQKMAEVDPSTVCQYTGLKDKNGTPIYEGDELEYDNSDFLFTRIVEWRKGAFRLGCNLLYMFDDEEKYLKVVGSKFDKEV